MAGKRVDTTYEDMLAFHLSANGITYEREYKAISGRRYRWDFRIGKTLLVEVQGGTWSRERSGHSTGAGIRRDCEKSNIAVMNGYKVLYFTSDMVKSGEAINTIIAMLDYLIGYPKLGIDTAA